MSTNLISQDEFSERAKRIRMVCFDVDGTLTDGRLLFDEHGGELKAFHVHDGQGLRLLEDSGISVALITARDSKIVRARGHDLRLKHVFVGVANKLNVLKELCASESIQLSEVAFMGDDLPDLACLQSAGLAACPNDALDVIQQSAHWCSNFNGGAGAARQFCDAILHAQDKHSVLVTRFSVP